MFKVLRHRAPHLTPLLDDLHAEHMRDSLMIAAMDHALVRYHGGAPHGLTRFKNEVDTYAATMMSHFSMEGSLHERARVPHHRGMVRDRPRV